MAKAKETAGRREIFVPKGAAREEQTMLISVNGKNYFVPKGKKTLVPNEVADEYERSVEAQEAFDRAREAMLSKE